MKDTLYIFRSDTILRKRGDTLEVIIPNDDGHDEHRKIPVSRLRSVETYGNMMISTPLLKTCNELKIPCFFNSYYGVPVGTFVPARRGSSVVKMKQYEAYQDDGMRLHIARGIVKKAISERIRVLRKYGRKDPFIIDRIAEMARYGNRTQNVTSVSELRGMEGNAMKTYFSAFSSLLSIPFEGRTKRPPRDEGNAILSFGNVLLYNTVEAAVFRASMDVQVGFLHEIHENRGSLAIDIAEIFRPIIVDNLILRLDRMRNLLPRHFDKDEFKCYLNNRGKEIWLNAFRSLLRSSIRYPPLKRSIAVHEEIKLECYNLIKYILQERDAYHPLRFKNR